MHFKFFADFGVSVMHNYVNMTDPHKLLGPIFLEDKDLDQIQRYEKYNEHKNKDAFGEIY